MNITVIYASHLLPDFKLMCDLMPAAQPAEKIGKMKKLRRTLSESFSRIGECPSSQAKYTLLLCTSTLFLQDSPWKVCFLCK